MQNSSYVIPRQPPTKKLKPTQRIFISPLTFKCAATVGGEEFASFLFIQSMLWIHLFLEPLHTSCSFFPFVSKTLLFVVSSDETFGWNVNRLVFHARSSGTCHQEVTNQVLGKTAHVFIVMEFGFSILMLYNDPPVKVFDDDYLTI